MPELPEVETTGRGIAPHVLHRRIDAVHLRAPALRWPIPSEIRDELLGQRIVSVQRLAKYLLLGAQTGHAIIHLGMSGMLRVLPGGTLVQKHDHVDLLLDSGRILRLTDPRRFGALLWQPAGSLHPLLAELGPEPLSGNFDGDHLWRRARGRKAPVKTFIMDQEVVVGVGNIYAAEALFRAGIHPLRAAGRVSRDRFAALALAIKAILAHAIERGGTTLRDFLNPDGAPGYFEQELAVYGREGESCPLCRSTIRSLRLGNRASCYCPRCQR
jgi:formamidopyrimidine-DNA glycosylase